MNNAFYSELFDFLTNKELYIFQEKKEASYLNNLKLGKLLPSIGKVVNKLQFVDFYENNKYKTYPDVTYLIPNGSVSYYDVEYKLYIEFIHSFFVNHRKEAKEWLCFCFDLNKDKFFKDIYSFANVNSNLKEFKEFFNSISLSYWKISSINLNELHSVVKKKLIGDELVDFWLSFLGKRTKQINTKKDGPRVRDFLIANFKDEELKKFIPVSSFLKADFEGSNFDFFENIKNEVSFSFLLNTKKMETSFCIDGWDHNDYEENLIRLLDIFKKKYDLELLKLMVQSRQRKLFWVNASFDSQKVKINVNKEKFQKLIVDFFNEYKTNSKLNTKDEAEMSLIVDRITLGLFFEKSTISKKIKM